MQNCLITNRTFKIAYRSSFVAVGLLGILASFGFFEYNYREEFYVYFTNLSNYLCFGIMLVEFILTLKDDRHRFAKLMPALKFAATLSILLTFFVFNFILADVYYGGSIKAKYEISSVLYHVVLPLMFTADTILFDDRKRMRLYFPVVSVLVPLLYGAFIYIRSAIPEISYKAKVVYPYFFMNVKNLGFEKVSIWLSVMLLVYIAAGYVLYAVINGVAALCEALKHKQLQ